MRGFQIVLMTVLCQGLLVLLITFAGGLLALGDSLAIFRLQIAAVILAGGILLWFLGNRAAAFATVLVASFALAPIVYGFSGLVVGPAGPYVFCQKNLFRKELFRSVLTKDILSLQPDILTLQEITEHDLKYMTNLFEAYDQQLICTTVGPGQVAILTAFPIIAGSETCLAEEKLAAVRVRLPDGTTPMIVSLHLGWPFPAGQSQQATRIADWLVTVEGPILIGGDFNMVPWGFSVRSIAQAARATRVGPYFGTFPESEPFIPLPIDHVLLPAGASGQAEMRPKLGSDHLGVVVRFDF